MPGKLKKTTRRTKVQDMPKGAKKLSRKQQKNVKGGLLPYIEQDNLKKPATKTPTSTVTYTGLE